MKRILRRIQKNREISSSDIKIDVLGKKRAVRNNAGILWIVISYLLVFVCIFTPATLSRYVSGSGGTSSASAARLSCKINSAQSMYNNGSFDIGQYLIVLFEFSVTNQDSEVSFEYDLGLKLSKNTAGTDSPANVSFEAPVADCQYIYTDISGITKVTNGNNGAYTATNGAFDSFSVGKIYYAVSDDGVSFTWKDTTAGIENGYYKIAENSSFKLGGESEHYYKIIAFINTYGGYDDIFLAYNLECEQVD